MLKKILNLSLAISFLFIPLAQSKTADKKTSKKPSNLIELKALDKSKAQFEVARVESFSEIKKLPEGRIGLVQIDNGDSTDIASAMASSDLYLTFFNDGSMRNYKAAFNLGGVNEFKIISKENSTIKLQLKCKDESLNEKQVDTLVDFTAYEKTFFK